MSELTQAMRINLGTELRWYVQGVTDKLRHDALVSYYWTL